VGRFKPLAEIMGDSVTACNQNVTSQVIDKYDRNRVTAKPQLFEGLQGVDGGGVAVATRDDFRRAEYHDITHAEAGMVQCRDCGYSQSITQRAGRCRHPDLHGGRWCVLGNTLWRRCQGYQVRVMPGKVD